MSTDISWTAPNTAGVLREAVWPGGGVAAFARVLTRTRIGSAHTWTREVGGVVRSIRVTRVSRQHAWVHVISTRGTYLMTVLAEWAEDTDQLWTTAPELIDAGYPPAQYRGQTVSIGDAVHLVDDWLDHGRLEDAWRLAPAL